MGAKASTLGVLAVAAAVSVTLATTPSNEPEPVVEERVRVHRVQLDVTVAGLPETVADLGVDDFEVVVGGRPIEQLTADAFCDPGPREGRAKDERPRSISARPMVALIYFDQSQLTAEGRLRSLQTARELVPSLVAGGNRVVIASNAREELVTYTPLTSDADVLLEALDRLAVDALQQDFAPDLEASQIAALESAADSTLQEGRFTERSLYTEKPSTSLMEQMEHAASDDLMFAETLSGDLMGMAHAFKADEIDRTDRSLRRFRLALDKLAAEDPPKIALYFGDTLRSNAGQHYLTLLDASQAAKATTSRAGLEPSRSRHGDIAFTEGRFDQLVDHAAGLGIRVYSVEGQGMTGASIRVRDAQGTFRSLGLETGGQAFLNGAEAPTIARRLRDDLSCFYLISFDPAGLPEDTPLPVRVRVVRPGVKSRTRGRLVVLGEENRRIANLRAAVLATRGTAGPLAVEAGVLPVGFSDGAFELMVQLRAVHHGGAGDERPADLHVLAQGRPWNKASRRLDLPPGGAPVVLDAMLRSEPGPLEIVAVLTDRVSGDRTATYIDSVLPDPGRSPVSILPPVLLQPTTGRFHRGDEVVDAGPATVAHGTAVDAALPLGVVTLVCRQPSKGPFHVERTLIGSTGVDFDPLTLERQGDRCVQLRDVVSAGAMGPGGFRYTVRVLDKRGEEVSAAKRDFNVVAATGSTPSSR